MTFADEDGSILNLQVSTLPVLVRVPSSLRTRTGLYVDPTLSSVEHRVLVTFPLPSTHCTCQDIPSRKRLLKGKGDRKVVPSQPTT